MRIGVRLAVIGLALGCIGQALVAQRRDPSEPLARVRVAVSTKAASASITVSGATVASYISAIDAAPPSTTTSNTGTVLQLSRKPEAFGRTVLEALSLCRPVLGYAHGGVGELLAELYPEGRSPPGDLTRLTERAGPSDGRSSSTT